MNTSSLLMDLVAEKWSEWSVVISKDGTRSPIYGLGCIFHLKSKNNSGVHFEFTCFPLNRKEIRWNVYPRAYPRANLISILFLEKWCHTCNSLFISQSKPLSYENFRSLYQSQPKIVQCPRVSAFQCQLLCSPLTLNSWEKDFNRTFFVSCNASFMSFSASRPHLLPPKSVVREEHEKKL